LPLELIAGSQLGQIRTLTKFLGHHSILTTARYTHLTDRTKHHALERINALMDGFTIDWGRVK
jgi:hypothetical protein